MTGQLMQQGMLPTREATDADLILLNSCSVREKAVQKVYSRLGEYRLLKRDRPHLQIGLCGCVAQQEGEEILARVPDLDFVLGPARVGELADAPRPAGRRRAGRRHRFPHRPALRFRLDLPRRSLQGNGHDHRRVQQALHLLHRAVDPRTGVLPHRRRDRTRGPPSARLRLRRDRAPRSDRQPLAGAVAAADVRWRSAPRVPGLRWPARLRRPARAPGGPPGAAAAALHDLLSARLLAAHGGAVPPAPEPLRRTPPAGAVGQRSRSCGAWVAATAMAAVSRAGRASCARRARRSRCRPTSSSASRASPTPTSTRRSTSCARCASPRSTPSAIRRAPARRPSSSPTPPSPSRSPRSGCSALRTSGRDPDELHAEFVGREIEVLVTGWAKAPGRPDRPDRLQPDRPVPRPETPPRRRGRGAWPRHHHPHPCPQPDRRLSVEQSSTPPPSLTARRRPPHCCASFRLSSRRIPRRDSYPLSGSSSDLALAVPEIGNCTNLSSSRRGARALENSGWATTLQIGATLNSRVPDGPPSPAECLDRCG